MPYFRQHALLAAHAVLFLLALAPLVASGPVLPLVDFPNHLARAYIVYSLDSALDLQEAYAVKWRLTPYLATDLLLVGLQHLVSVYTAGKICVALAFLALVAGVASLSRTLHGQTSWLTLLVYPLLFSQPLYWGFVNFLLGLGIALISYVLWLRLQQSRWRYLALFALLNLNFFVHVISYGLLVLLVVLRALLVLDARSRWKRAATPILLTLPQLGFWFFIPTDVAATNAWFEYGDFSERLAVFLSPFYSYNPPLDALFLLLFGLTLLRRQEWLPLERTHAIMAWIFLALALLAPKGLFGIAFTHIRLPLAAMLLLVAAAHFPPVSRFRSFQYGFLAVTCLLTVIRLVPIAQEMKTCSGALEEVRLALRGVKEAGAPLLSVQAPPPRSPCRNLHAFDHASALAAIEGHLFAPLVFTVIPPVKPAEKYLPLEVGVGNALHPGVLFDPKQRAKEPYLEGWERKFRYVLWLHFEQRDYTLPKNLVPVHEGSYFTLFLNRAYVRP